MKKLIFVLSLILVIAMSSLALAESGVVIRLDMEEVEFNDDFGFPFIDENFRTQVPFTVTMKKFGAEVDWDDANRTAIAKKGDIEVRVPIGENFILRNGEKIETDAVALLIDSRTYLPIRPVMEAFGAEVEWDEELSTVVLTTEPVDAKGILLDAYDKSSDWESFEMAMTMNMSIPQANESGNDEIMGMQIIMDMATISEPFKAKASMEMFFDLGAMKIPLNRMNMYYTIEESGMTTYIEMPGEDGETQWFKQTQENEMFEMLMEDKEANTQLNEESIKDVRFLGKYIDGKGRVLLRIENTTSFDAYEEILGGYMEMLSSSDKEEDKMAADMLANMDDMTFIVYIDEETGEIVKYNMDMSSMMKSMFSSMEEIIPAEELEMLSGLKMIIEMEVSNVNGVEDFEIPEEVLNADELQDFSDLEGLNVLPGL
ncbi:MAG: copper amine oxidase N-terminal domain-containing protein [Tissierellaceae bacterium]|nr:copper amine oxidase N-terminal domain-containing protein [Tissierellaceae bacterium]